ncbi:tetratricopeptide repeat protein [Aerosakkonemataceae cyanobacterium BLCC-F50]|uniref:Tetratricopeptide repeat protein n=1 Tax=Floridaenema flaviceps BLCC-F50 TaxID=3153642 RepID=A0ABV4Y0F4_9CYAN
MNLDLSSFLTTSVSLFFSLILPVQPAEISPNSIPTVLGQTPISKNQILSQLPEPKLQADSLFKLGVEKLYQSQFSEALQIFEQVLKIRQGLGDRAGVGITLSNMGEIYGELNQYSKALEILQQALLIHQELGDKVSTGETLRRLGIVYKDLGQYDKAMAVLQQALAISKQVGDRLGEGRTLLSIGIVYRRLSQYDQALKFYQEALEIARITGDRITIGRALNNIGLVYYSKGQYSRALEYYQQALTIRKDIKDRSGEAVTLSFMGTVYDSLGEYQKALDFYQQALTINQTIGKLVDTANLHNDIGGIYYTLGQYDRALLAYKKGLTIIQQLGARPSESATLNNIGLVYDRLGQYTQAINFYQQSLAIKQEIGDRAGAANTLTNIGIVYDRKADYSQALEYLQKSLAIRQNIGDRSGEAITFNSIAVVYQNNGQHQKAWDTYQRALAIQREIGDRPAQRVTLSNIAFLLEKRNQPELAIVFYKQSVNVTEAIRENLKPLSREQQESYTQTVADTYRSLANLLLSQGRILEAQQILELLKIQELRQFTENSRAGGETNGSQFNPTEEKIIEIYGSLIAFGQQVDECQKNRCSQLGELLDKRDALTRQYNQSVESLVKQIRSLQTQDEAILNPKDLGRKAREIIAAQPGTVLIYPLVLKEKIWLLWAAPGGIVKSLEIPVKQEELGKTVLKFRLLLQTPNSNIAEVKVTGKQLYDWLIKPLESELKTNPVKNLVFSLDRVTRYIPMSALFDGQKYLIENYTISTILSAELTDVRDRLPFGAENISVLALGLSEQILNFNALPNVKDEINRVVRQKNHESQGIYPGQAFLNREFDFRTLRDNLSGKKILHIATHGQFVAGRPKDSYLLLGTGEKLTIPQIETLQDLVDVHLVVLSACETALGGPDSEGVEIAGISYYFLGRGAKAVIASLWQVSDRSTSELMQDFYSNLAKGTNWVPVSKTAALQQAQLSLLNKGFVHPYYWAPFILIGNSL